MFLFIYFPLANDELLKAFGRSKDGNIRVIKASIEKGNWPSKIAENLQFV